VKISNRNSLNATDSILQANGILKSQPTACLHIMFFNPEDGSSGFLQNVGKLPPECMTSHQKR
jgi:hypothetical protein